MKTPHLVLPDEAFLVYEESKAMVEAQHIFKNGKEFIISQYNKYRYFIAVVDEEGNITPKFPFETKEAAAAWVENIENRERE